MLLCCFLDISVGVGAFATGLNQIYSFFTLTESVWFLIPAIIH